MHIVLYSYSLEHYFVLPHENSLPNKKSIQLTSFRCFEIKELFKKTVFRLKIAFLFSFNVFSPKM